MKFFNPFTGVGQSDRRQSPCGFWSSCRRSGGQTSPAAGRFLCTQVTPLLHPSRFWFRLMRVSAAGSHDPLQDADSELLLSVYVFTEVIVVEPATFSAVMSLPVVLQQAQRF